MSRAERRNGRHNHQHSSTTATPGHSSSFFSPIHQRIIEWEDRLRRWKFFSRNRSRRSASSDPKAVNSLQTVLSGPLFSSRTNTPKKRPVNFPPGSFTCPVPRRNMNLSGRPRPSMETDRPPVSEEEMNRQYIEIQARSGVIEIGPQRYEGIKIENLKLKAELGSGTCGSVTKRVLDNRFLAVKEMKRTDNEQETRRIFTDLQVICKSNDCPYIVKCYGYILTFDHVYICMEMMAMCLEKLYKERLMPQNIFIPEGILGQITISVIKALKYLKDTHEIIHRDVKPSNILIDWNGNVKLCDFGIAGQLIDSLASTTSIGCVAYLSPERLRGDRQYDVRADIWSLGITLVELAMFQYPYPYENPFALMVNITDQPAPSLPDSFSREMREFVSQCLQKDQMKRPKYTDLVELDWYQINDNNVVDVGSWLADNLGNDED